MFNHLNEEEIKDFLNNFKRKKVKAGEIIIREGEESDCAFILVENGEIEVSKKTYEGKEYVVSIVKPEDRVVFNETSLIDEKGSFSTLRALKDSTVIVIHKKNFFDYIHKNPQMGVKILESMLINCAKHLRKRDDDIIALFNTIEILLNE
jgi:CRP/FNR family cyclic AMP-dependent transcriptional regulator